MCRSEWPSRSARRPAAGRRARREGRATRGSWRSRLAPSRGVGSARPGGHALHLAVILAAPVRHVLQAEEVQLDGEAVGILDEELIEIRLGQRARPVLEPALLEAPDELPG